MLYALCYSNCLQNALTLVLQWWLQNEYYSPSLQYCHQLSSEIVTMGRSVGTSARPNQLCHLQDIFVVCQCLSYWYALFLAGSVLWKERRAVWILSLQIPLQHLCGYCNAC
jgi:hypothetical protein